MTGPRGIPLRDRIELDRARVAEQVRLAEWWRLADAETACTCGPNRAPLDAWDLRSEGEAS